MGFVIARKIANLPNIHMDTRTQLPEPNTVPNTSLGASVEASTLDANVNGTLNKYMPTLQLRSFIRGG